MNTYKALHILIVVFALADLHAIAREYHVTITGSDFGDGSMEHPFKMISSACRVARAGDTITVHGGTYREWIDPIHGGSSNLKRILYRSAEGETVVIKGSEIMKGWQKLNNGVWKLTINNALFGNYNPYREIVFGDWFLDYGRVHHTGEVYLNGKSLYEIDSLDKVVRPVYLRDAQDQEGSLYQWYCKSDNSSTTLWANFHEYDPNKELVEINVRPRVFYPKKSGIDFITVRGFTISQGATNWAPPTAEQTGLIGPNWSKGWIIENNIISDSKCSGISIGKGYGADDNSSVIYKIKNGHISQLETVFNAIKNGWSKENVGSHSIRNNIIFHCEQTGICGNMGAIFSEIYGNHIYDIYTKRQWGGFEMAGIKLHAPIDVIIRNNCIHNSFKGIWIDWQAQGIRITGNAFYNNSWMDLHLEVSHGPHTIDNNCFLSDLNLWNQSTGSAFINNLFAGQICKATENERYTPYHYPHSTKIAGIMTTQGGDDRYYNNVFIKTPAPPYDIFEKANRPKRGKGVMDYGLGIYENFPADLIGNEYAIGEMSKVLLPVKAENNLYLNGAIPYKNSKSDIVYDEQEAIVRIKNKPDGIYLHLKLSGDLKDMGNQIINSAELGEALVPEAVFESADGNPIQFNRDYLGAKRDLYGNRAGPITSVVAGENIIRIWPK